MIVAVDYGMGNLRSVQKAGEFLGKKIRITDKPATIKKASKIIFPGVGHFGQAVKELKKRKLYDVLKERIDCGVPFLGICLGMQLLFEKSEEAPKAKGLSVLKGTVKLFNKKGLRVPQMGWNQVNIKEEPVKGSLFKGVKDKSYFYFAQSYYCAPKSKKVIAATANYGLEYAVSVHKDNIYATQFHPEKSQKCGLKVFDNFLKL